MNLVKRKGSPYWYVRVKRNGTVYQESTGTNDKKAARAFAVRYMADLWAKQKGMPAYVKYTLKDTIDRYSAEKAGMPSLERDLECFARIPAYIRFIDDLDKAALDQHLKKIAALTSPNNAIRHRAAISSLLGRARRWEYIPSVPTLPVIRKEAYVPKWITRDQFNTILECLPEHARNMARFAAETGLRYSNVAGFKWEWIRDGVGYVPASEAKAGRAIPVPLSSNALGLIEALRGAHPRYVFTDHRGNAPVGAIKTSWLEAVKKAGFPGFRFHDIRHCWASWHLQEGTPLHVLKQLGGWQSYKMVTEVYGHFATEHLKEYVK